MHTQRKRPVRDRVRIDLNPAEAAELELLATKSGLSKANVVRELLKAEATALAFGGEPTRLRYRLTAHAGPSSASGSETMARRARSTRSMR